MVLLLNFLSQMKLFICSTKTYLLILCILIDSSGADSGFLERGGGSYVERGGGSLCLFKLIFLKYPMKMK